MFAAVVLLKLEFKFSDLGLGGLPHFLLTCVVSIDFVLWMEKFSTKCEYVCVVPPQSWGDRSDTKHSKCLLLGGRRLNQLTLIPKPKGSGGARAAMAQVGPANKRNDTKRCLPIEVSLRPGEAIPW